MLPIGIPELLFLGFFLGIPVIVVVLFFGLIAGRRAKRLGFGSTRAYPRAAPRTDDERRDAVDLALKGLVVCVIGILIPPLVLVGLIPLFYGGRKLMYASMGLGLVDDGNEPRA